MTVILIFWILQMLESIEIFCYVPICVFVHIYSQTVGVSALFSHRLMLNFSDLNSRFF